MATIDNMEELIDGLTDMDDAIQMLTRFGIDADEVEDLAEAQLELKKYFSNLSRSTTANIGDVPSSTVWTVQNSTEIVQRLMNENKATREDLQRQVRNVKNHIQNLPEHRLVNLKEAFPNAVEDLDEVGTQLDRNECVILVAGETGAGKSTLLNLLMGEIASDLLPVAHLSSTSVICELKYSTSKKMVVYSRDETKPALTVNLDSDASKRISQYVHQIDRSDTFQYSRVEIHWPCNWLKGGITIVDSPGVGEDPELTELVKRYLPKAFGFIYVINTPIAGGIDPDRLQDLIFSHVAEQKKNQAVGQFNPRSAVFVCNKWDEIPLAQREQIKTYVMEQLHKAWPGFKEDQVFFISARKTLAELNDDIVSNDYKTLLTGIERLIPVGLKMHLSKQYATASKIIERSQFILKSFICEGDLKAEQMVENIAVARDKLNQFEEKPNLLREQLYRKAKTEVESAVMKLRLHLENSNTLKKLCDWKESECQYILKSSNMDSFLERMQDKASKRIKTEIGNWESENKIFENIHKNHLAFFKKNFQALDEELKKIETNFAFDHKSGNELQSMIDQITAKDVGANDDDDISFTKQEKLFIGLTSPIWVPVGLVIAIVALPIAGVLAIRRKLKENKELKTKKKNVREEMASMTREIIDAMLRSDDLRNSLHEKILNLVQSFEVLLKYIPQLIEADRKLFEKLETELTDNYTALREVYRQRYGIGMDLQGKLDCLYITDIRAYDIEKSELYDYTYIDEGAFARVFTADWKKNKLLPIRVAVKWLKTPVTVENATEILNEETNLRNLQTANVVQLYGTSVARDDNDFYPLLVMELCEKTLAQIIYEPSQYKAPGNMSDRDGPVYITARKQAATYACQISSGLMAIHHKGYVHRDLKPDNIMVDRRGIIKLCDFGLAKKVSDVTGSLCGTLLYMAPEVQQQTKYTEKADMFGFGMIMWELWYGISVIIEYQVDNLHEFLAQPYPRNREPVVEWKALMKTCWCLEPEKRPSAHDCCRIINANFLAK